jgi:inner membrane protein
MAGFAAISALPDADALAFVFRIPYANQFGHRGATHSIVFALLCGVGAFLFARSKRSPLGGDAGGERNQPQPARVAIIAALTSLSHPLLDMLTNGGLGCALFWPFSTDRIFFPIGPIPVAPIGLDMISMGGLLVIAVETIMFSPFLLYATWPRKARPADATA